MDEIKEIQRLIEIISKSRQKIVEKHDKAKPKVKAKPPTPKRKLPEIKFERVDHTSIWSKVASRRRRFNRLDPDPDPPLDLTDYRGELKEERYTLPQDYWINFWADRVRRHYGVQAPSLTDKEIYSAVMRCKKIYLSHWEDNRRPHIDPDLPSCYYWDQHQVAKWLDTVGVSEHVKETFLHNGINGRRLITLDTTTLPKMGIYKLGTIKQVTKAARQLLGLPDPNALRAMGRFVPLEKFLHLKVRTGAQNEKMTFKQFCEREGVEYEPAVKQKKEGYKKIPGCVKVTIKPKEEDVRWIPIEMPKKKPRDKLPYFPYTPSEYEIHVSSSSSSSGGDDDGILEAIPTVEELAENAELRNEIIPVILEDLVEAVYEGLKANEAEGKCRQELADQILKERMEMSYSYFNISDPEEKLKLITIVAEELVEDISRAKEILEDIEGFQEKVRSTIPEQEMKEVVYAVANYVQGIMPHVVRAALKEMNESESDLIRSLERKALAETFEKDENYKELVELCKVKDTTGAAAANSDSDPEVSADEDEVEEIYEFEWREHYARESLHTMEQNLKVFGENMLNFVNKS